MNRTRQLIYVVGSMLLVFMMGMLPGRLVAQQSNINKVSDLYVTNIGAKTFYKGDIQTSISLSFSEIPVGQALRIIARKGQLKLTYRGDIIPHREVTLQNKSITVTKALNKVLNGLPLDYRVSKDRYLLIIPKKVHIQATVSGTVTDAQTGKPLPSVNILVVSTNTGTTTNAEGHYNLQVPSMQDTLRFSFIGYKTQIVPIQGHSTIDISMKPAIISGKELVVIGFGTQRQENLTGAVASVSGKDIKNLPVGNFKGAIAGKMAGVQINSVNGRPGGGGTIRIRGIGSIGAGNSPLIVVDGFPTSAINIPPNEIKSIQVLKDASATAIYGSRGANGVILITTKKAIPETQIQIGSSVGFQIMRKRGMPQMMNAREYAQFRKERIQDRIRFYEGIEPTPKDIPKMFRHPEQYGEGTNWIDEIFKPAIIDKQYISIAGGSEEISSRVSFNRMNQQGILLGTYYKRYNLRGEINGTLFDDKLNVNLSIAHSLKNYNYARAGRGRSHSVIEQAYLGNPIIPVRNDDGSFTAMMGGPGVLAMPNPVLKIKKYLSEIKNRVDRTVIHTSVDYDILKGLNIKSSFGISFANSRNRGYKPSYIGGFWQYPPTKTIGEFNTIRSINWQSRNTIHWEKMLGESSFKVLGGFTFQRKRNNYGNFRALEYPDNKIHTFNAAQTIIGNTHRSGWSLVSVLGRINYSYKNKYLLTASVRRDASSRFGVGNRWGLFPSVSIGWDIAGESFMKKFDNINQLKLRVGYGQSGNFNIGNYAHLGIIGNSYYVLNNELITGRAVTRLGNSRLGWEEMNQLNVGLDLRMFENRLKITVDYYRKVTSNMLLQIKIPFTSGFGSSLTNRGEVINKGIEFTVKSTVIQTPSLNWNINFNITHNSNEVTKLKNRILSAGNRHITKEGYPVSQFFGYVVTGFFKNEKEIKSSPSYKNAIPGAFQYKDINGDGKITPVDDWAIIGNPFPDFTGGLTSSLNYKNFDFQITTTFQYGGQVLQRGLREDMSNLSGLFNVIEAAKYRWKSPKNSGRGVLPRAISRPIHRYPRSTWVADASNFWIRDITLGYSFSQSKYDFLKSISLERLRVYFNVHNAFISNGKLQNPSAAQHPNNPLRIGIIRSTVYPLSKVFTFGVNLKF